MEDRKNKLAVAFRVVAAAAVFLLVAYVASYFAIGGGVLNDIRVFDRPWHRIYDPLERIEDYLHPNDFLYIRMIDEKAFDARGRLMSDDSDLAGR